MTGIRNTTADMNDPNSPDLLLLLATGMSTGSPSDFIYAQERAGQRQLVNSAMLPTDVRDDDKQRLADMGVALGDPDPADPLFAPATLPDGWAKQASDHDMWSYVIDHLGRRRIAVFYKAAFYDRKAHMRLVSLSEYVSAHAHGESAIVLDTDGGTWATAETVAEAALSLADGEAEQIEEYQGYAADPAREANREYWIKRVAECQQVHAAYIAIAQRYSGGTS